MVGTVLTSMSLSLSFLYSLTQQQDKRVSVQLTAEERILVAVVSTVVVAIAQAFRIDADVVAFALDLARRTRPVRWRGQRLKH